ncbi:hypothetical protein AKUA1404_04800 [Apilactobacillus kunkeei]|nr:hypothetical protein AKUA1404_04800 [Apilactobacillus kunkeei]
MTKTNVPRLRFKNFNEEWQDEKAKNIFINKSIKNHGKDKILASTQDNGIMYRKDLDKDIKFDNSTLNNYKYVIPGNVVISLRSFQGGFEISDKEGIISPAYTIMSFKNDDNNTDYWKQYLKTYKFIQSLKKVTFGIRDGRSISFKEFSTLKLKFTENKNEQQKIGSFFSKIDKLIELQTQNLEQLKKLKRGYLQKMFPQDGESIPRWRFSGFSGEWEKQGLINLAKLRTGSRNAEDGVDDGKFVFFDRSSEMKFLNEYDFDGEVIVYAGEGAKFLPRKFDGKYSLHQRAYGIYDFKNINFDFLYQELLNKNNHFLKYAVGTTAKSLRKDCFQKLIIKYPGVDEQRRIGFFLSKLDQIINNQFDKIDKLKQQKKAYLQKMFI